MSKRKNKASMKQEVKDTIFIFSAHSDDFVIGCGGTIAKLREIGKNVRCYIFSYGEKSHPWMRAEEVKSMRASETDEACKILGCEAEFFDLRELHFREDAKKYKIVKYLKDEFDKYTPSRIFLHSKEDPHPDHKDVHALGMQMIKRVKAEEMPEVYVYSVWNIFEFKTKYPALFVDVKETFELKMEAMRAFPSQQVHIAFPTFMLLFRAFRDGLYSKHKLAEKFFLVKTKLQKGGSK